MELLAFIRKLYEDRDPDKRGVEISLQSTGPYDSDTLFALMHENSPIKVILLREGAQGGDA